MIFIPENMHSLHQQPEKRHFVVSPHIFRRLFNVYLFIASLAVIMSCRADAIAYAAEQRQRPSSNPHHHIQTHAPIHTYICTFAQPSICFSFFMTPLILKNRCESVLHVWVKRVKRSKRVPL